MTLGDRVYSALSGSTELMALVKGVSFAYPSGFSEEHLPAVSYYIIQDKKNHQFGGTNYSDKVVCIDIWSYSPEDNEAIYSKVTAALNFMLEDVAVDVPEKICHKNIKYFMYE